MFASWHYSAQGLQAMKFHLCSTCGCNIIFSLSPSKYPTCKQGTSAGKAILHTETTPIIPTIHCSVYTPEWRTCLHTDPQWAPGKTARRKNDSYRLQSFATKVIKRWGNSSQGVSPPLLTVEAAVYASVELLQVQDLFTTCTQYTDKTALTEQSA